ncbi:MAG: hypothetical protein HY202_06050 [Nitrospirae bacterium]|nr:hypothetical protein [Nitrospirota bacterium]
MFLRAEGLTGSIRSDYYTSSKMLNDQNPFFVGKQIVVWGRADGINPTDNLTPHDFTVLLPFEDDQRFGTTALKLDLYITYAFTDHLKGTFGGEIYTGLQDSFFGRLHENQGIFTELRYSF